MLSVMVPTFEKTNTTLTLTKRHLIIYYQKAIIGLSKMFGANT
jgi:hypothetical protein